MQNYQKNRKMTDGQIQKFSCVVKATLYLFFYKKKQQLSETLTLRYNESRNRLKNIEQIKKKKGEQIQNFSY